MPWIKRDVPLTGNIMGEAAMESSDFNESIETTDPDYVAWILGKEKTKKLASLTAQQEAIINGGVVYNTNTFQSDSASHGLMSRAISMSERGNATFFPINWTDMNNNIVSVTQVELTAIFDLTGRLCQGACDQYETLRISINAAIDQTALDAIDITTGWPTVPYTGV